METSLRLGEQAPTKEELPDLIKTLWRALDEIGNAIEALQRQRD
jgi:hypothetical protein